MYAVILIENDPDNPMGLEIFILENAFYNIQEAEEYRENYLDQHPNANPQNTQVLQYDPVD